MKIIAASTLLASARKKLEALGDVLFLDPQPSVYPSIACHPDIFFFQHENQLITNPELPNTWENWLISHQISFRKGNNTPQGKYPLTAPYNAVSSGNSLIHNLKYTDPLILSLFDPQNRIHVNQAYTRCNLLSLNEETFITSDRGILKILATHQKNVLYLHPETVRLPGHSHGFIGGCCGIAGCQLFVNGSIKMMPEGEIFIKFIEKAGFEAVELHKGILTDVGSLMFIL